MLRAEYPQRAVVRVDDRRVCRIGPLKLAQVPGGGIPAQCAEKRRQARHHRVFRRSERELPMRRLVLVNHEVLRVVLAEATHVTDDGTMLGMSAVKALEPL